ncbi:MAG: flagellar FlbD family protein [Actinomycetota bacterium]|nr:flagellar FlbD family protein [Actinomycetota bacterium]
MIRLHRLGRPDEPFHLNPDLIATVEATPDTVVTLTAGTKLVVDESPEAVVELIRSWRGSILTAATRRRSRSTANLALVRATSSDGAVAARHPEGDPR